MVAFKNCINHLDILSIPPEIKVKGNSRFITSFGILISSLGILIIVLFAIFAILNVFERNKFTVVYNLDNREIPSIPVNNSQTALLLLDALGNEIPDGDRYFSIRAGMLKIEIPTNSSDSNKSVSNYSYELESMTENLTNTANVSQIITPTTALSTSYLEKLPKGSIIELPVKSCRNMQFTKFQDFYNSVSKIYTSSMCIDFSGLNGEKLFGKYGSLKGYSIINIYIIKCSNSTFLNKTNCFSDDIINKRLSQVFISLIGIENDVDPNNFNNPILEYYNNDILPISSSIYKNYFKEMNSVKFKSENGLILGQDLNYKSYRTDAITESVDLRGANSLFPGTIAQITFRCSGKTEIYVRTYMKIPASFAEIGGILQAVLLIGRSLVYFFSKNSMLSYLIFQVFDKEEINYMLLGSKGANEDKKFNTDKKINFTCSPMDASDSNIDLITKFNQLKKVSEANDKFNIVNVNKFKLDKSDKLGSIKSGVMANDHNLNSSKINKSRINNINNQNVEDIIKNKNLVFKNFSAGQNNVKIGELIKLSKPKENAHYSKTYDENEGNFPDNNVDANKEIIYNVNNKKLVIKNDNEKEDNVEIINKIAKIANDKNLINPNLKNASNLNSDLNYNSNHAYKLNNNDNSGLHNLNDLQKEIKEKNESKIMEKIKDMSDTFKSKEELSSKIFSFAELFCMKEFINERRKRNFMMLSNDIIDKKISLEYLLKYYSNLEKMKMIILSKEQQEVFSAMPNFSLEKHVNEIINMGK